MVIHREFENDNETGELFKRCLAFHNTKTDTVILVYGVCKNGYYACHRLNYYDTHLLNINYVEMFPAFFWKAVAFDEVVEIDVCELPGMQLVNQTR
jgi:uncharacterized CHY-type Zn-finger protein